MSPWIKECKFYLALDEKLDGRYYQWQKSLETTHNVSSLSKNGANTFPKNASFLLSIAPIRIGTIFMSFLSSLHKDHTLNKFSINRPLKYLPNIWKMHFYAMFILVCIDIHFAKVACGFELIDSYHNPKSHQFKSSHVWIVFYFSLSLSKGKGPSGVAYSLQIDNEHPSRYTWWDGPRMKTLLLISKDR